MQGRGQASLAGQLIEAPAGLPGRPGHQLDPFILQIGHQLRVQPHMAGLAGAHHQHLGLGRQGLGHVRQLQQVPFASATSQT